MVRLKYRAMLCIASPAWAHAPARERSSLLFAEGRPPTKRAEMRFSVSAENHKSAAGAVKPQLLRLLGT